MPGVPLDQFGVPVEYDDSAVSGVPMAPAADTQGSFVEVPAYSGNPYGAGEYILRRSQSFVQKLVFPLRLGPPCDPTSDEIHAPIQPPRERSWSHGNISSHHDGSPLSSPVFNPASSDTEPINMTAYPPQHPHEPAFHCAQIEAAPATRLLTPPVTSLASSGALHSADTERVNLEMLPPCGSQPARHQPNPFNLKATAAK